MVSNNTSQQQPEGALNEPDNNEDEDEDEDEECDIDGLAVESFVNIAKTVSDIFYKCITTANNGLQWLKCTPRISTNHISPNSSRNSYTSSNSQVMKPTVFISPSYEQLMVYPSALATFYALSDLSRICGMKCECIHTIETWRKGLCQYDTVIVVTDPLCRCG